MQGKGNCYKTCSKFSCQIGCSTSCLSVCESCCFLDPNYTVNCLNTMYCFSTNAWYHVPQQCRGIPALDLSLEFRKTATDTVYPFCVHFNVSPQDSQIKKLLLLYCSHIPRLEGMGGTGLRFESWEVKNHTKNSSQHHISTPILLLSERKMIPENWLEPEKSHPQEGYDTSGGGMGVGFEGTLQAWSALDWLWVWH